MPTWRYGAEFSNVHRHKRPREETPFRRWLDAHGVSRYAAATALGLTEQSVHLYANGQVLPSLVSAFKIERFTRGAVTAESWLATTIGRLAWVPKGMTPLEATKKARRAAKARRREEGEGGRTKK